MQPLLVGRTLKIHPAVVLGSVALGGTLFGIIGAFLAVPAVAAVQVITRYIREQVESAAGQASDPTHRRSGGSRDRPRTAPAGLLRRAARRGRTRNRAGTASARWLSDPGAPPAPATGRAARRCPAGRSPTPPPAAPRPAAPGCPGTRVLARPVADLAGVPGEVDARPERSAGTAPAPRSSISPSFSATVASTSAAGRSDQVAASCRATGSAGPDGAPASWAAAAGRRPAAPWRRRSRRPNCPGPNPRGSGRSRARGAGRPPAPGRRRRRRGSRRRVVREPQSPRSRRAWRPRRRFRRRGRRRRSAGCPATVKAFQTAWPGAQMSTSDPRDDPDHGWSSTVVPTDGQALRVGGGRGDEPDVVAGGGHARSSRTATARWIAACRPLKPRPPRLMLITRQPACRA